MRMDFPVIKPLTLAIAALFMSTALHAADEAPAAGVVVMVVGQVTATGRAGGGHPLQRRSNIFSGETIVTGKDSRVQIRFSDGSLVSLQEGSQFRIESFSYKDKGDNATYQLLKGGNAHHLRRRGQSQPLMSTRWKHLSPPSAYAVLIKS